MGLQYFCSSWCCLAFIRLFCLLVRKSIRSLTRQPSQLVQISKVSLLAHLHCHRRLPRPHLHCKHRLRFEEHSNCVRRIENRRGRETNFTILTALAIYFCSYCDVTTNSQKSISYDVINYKFLPHAAVFCNYVKLPQSFFSRLPFSTVKIFISVDL